MTLSLFAAILRCLIEGRGRLAQANGTVQGAVATWCLREQLLTSTPCRYRVPYRFSGFASRISGQGNPGIHQIKEV